MVYPDRAVRPPEENPMETEAKARDEIVAPIKVGVSIRDAVIPFTFRYGRHLVVRLKERGGYGKFASVNDFLIDCFGGDRRLFVAERPKGAMFAMKHDFKRSDYLWLPDRDLMFVLEDDETIPGCSFVKTVYHASESGWVNTWKRRTPPSHRASFAQWLANGRST